MTHHPTSRSTTREESGRGTLKKAVIGCLFVAVVGLLVTGVTTGGQEHERARQLSPIAGQEPFTLNQLTNSITSGSLRGAATLSRELETATTERSASRMLSTTDGTNVTYTLRKESGTKWAALYVDVREPGVNGSAPVVVRSTRVFEMTFRRWFYNFFVTFWTMSNDFVSLWIRNECTDQVPSRVADRILRQDKITFDSGSGSHLPYNTEGVSIAHDYEWTGLPVGTIASVQGQIDAELEACILNQAPGTWNPAYVDFCRGLWALPGAVCTGLFVCPGLAAGGKVSGL